MAEVGLGNLWVLNLDGEHELEAIGNYAPNNRLKAIVEGSRTSLWAGRDALLRTGDLVLADPGSDARGLRGERIECLRVGDGNATAELVEREHLAGLRGRMWMPTARARGALLEVGADFEKGPGTEVMRLVNSREFAARVRADLAMGSFEKRVAGDLETALATLVGNEPDGWLVRRRFGAAGRGRRKIHGGLAALSEADVNWLIASLRFGPLVIEPFVNIVTEFTRSGFVSNAGEVIVAQPCFQATSDTGAWQRTEVAGAGGVSKDDDIALAHALEVAGRAIAQAGYFGPFGIDAFRYRDPGRPGQTLLNPLSEINARYTMDWALGMGSARALALTDA